MIKTNEKIINTPTEELTLQEIRALGKTNKDSYVNRYILKILEINKETGLTSREIHTKIGYLSMPTLNRFLEELIAKRQIYKVRAGTSVNYFPNHRPLHPLVNKTISIEDNKKYKFQLIEIENDLDVYIQEIERDLLGREEVKGGVLIPLKSVKNIGEFLIQLSEERPKLIEEFKKIKMQELDKKLYGDDEI